MTADSKRNVRTLLIDATQRLRAAGIDSARTDAELLLCHILDVPRMRLSLVDDLDSAQYLAFERALTRRMSRVPLQHITGRAPFRYLDLAIGGGALVPRPETEIVAEAAIRFLRAREDDGPRPLVFDFCSGAAPIALALATECDGIDVIGVEKYEDAQQWGRRNLAAQQEAIAARGNTCALLDADVCDAQAFSEYAGRADVVVSNPPYIPNAMVPRDPEVAAHDPREALYGGVDGMDIVRGLLVTAALVLRTGGLLVIEHADAQGPAAVDGGLPAVVAAQGDFVDIADHNDLTGRPRYTTARRA